MLLRWLARLQTELTATSLPSFLLNLFSAFLTSTSMQWKGTIAIAGLESCIDPADEVWSLISENGGTHSRVCTLTLCFALTIHGQQFGCLFGDIFSRDFIFLLFCPHGLGEYGFTQHQHSNSRLSSLDSPWGGVEPMHFGLGAGDCICHEWILCRFELG